MSNADATEPYSVEIPLKLYFATQEPVAIKDIASSLLALERLTKQFPAMLEQLTKVKIHGYELRVERLESGSLLEDLVLKVFFDNPEQQKKFNDFLENHPMGKAVKWGVGGILTVLVISQLMLVYKNFAGTDTPSIQANHNTIINVGAESLGITPSEVQELVTAGISGNHKKLFQASLDVLRPVEGHEEASLQVPGMQEQRFSFPPAAMAEVPFDADLNAQEHDLDYENELLEIRALDRDKTDAGWWGVLPNVIGEKRLKLYFVDDVDMQTITTRPEVHVDATVTYRNDLNQAKLIPKYITISRVYPPAR